MPSQFLSTLSLRRATSGCEQYCIRARISIHALLAESDRLPTALRTPHHRFLSTLSLRRATSMMQSMVAILILFLSTLSLRRATSAKSTPEDAKRYFYPRSPCGERPELIFFSACCIIISIHALLAESDSSTPAVRSQFKHFYPRSPCGERLST